MFSSQFFLRSATDLGRPIMPKTQIRMVTTMITERAVRLFCMEVRLFRSYVLFFALEQARNRAARDLDLDIIRLDAQNESVITVDRDNGSHNTTAGQNRVAVLKAGQHLLLVLALALHGHEEQEIEDRKDKKDGEESHQRAGRRCL